MFNFLCNVLWIIIYILHLKKLRLAEGGAKIFGVFRVRNHDFSPKNNIFSNFRGGARRVPPPPPGSAPLSRGVVRNVSTYIDIYGNQNSLEIPAPPSLF
jgi:hypothetical protein